MTSSLPATHVLGFMFTQIVTFNDEACAAL